MAVMDALVPTAQPIPALSLASARLALEQATDLPTVAAMVPRLEVIRVAAQRAKASLDAQNDWASLKLEAERKAGRMLSELRRSGELRSGRPNADMPSALHELGISQQQSSRWQRLAGVPQERFSQWLAETRAMENEITEAALFALAVRAAPEGSPGAPFVPPAPAPRADVPRNVMLEGDCLPILRTLPDNSVDALVTDPPAAISFMGATWDSDRGGREQWVGWMTEVMRECHRVLKPGAHGLVWALPRTSHWTAWALEDAGFEIRDQVLHVFAQGFPKSLDVSKALGAKVLTGMCGPAAQRLAAMGEDYEPTPLAGTPGYGRTGNFRNHDTGSPSMTIEDDAAKAWEGRGTALKPAHEVWWLVRKAPEGPVALNALRWGTGALNIDGCRIPFAGDVDFDETANKNDHAKFGTKPGGNHVYGDDSMVARTSYRDRMGGEADLPRAGNRTATFGRVGEPTTSGGDGSGGWQADPIGRWPSTVVLTDAVFDGDYPDEVVGGGRTDVAGNRPARRTTGSWANKPPQVLDGQRMDAGSKSRFFLLPKANRRDRDGDVDGNPISVPAQRWVQYQTGNGKSGRPSSLSAGRDTRYRNTHETVKPRALMEHLVKLIAPKGGVVLDPFAGSGRPASPASRWVATICSSSRIQTRRTSRVHGSAPHSATDRGYCLRSPRSLLLEANDSGRHACLRRRGRPGAAAALAQESAGTPRGGRVRTSCWPLSAGGGTPASPASARVKIVVGIAAMPPMCTETCSFAAASLRVSTGLIADRIARLC